MGVNTMSWKAKATILILLTLFGFVLLWGAGIEPRIIDNTRYQVAIPALPDAWQDQRVAFFADMQTGMWLDNEGTIKRIIDGVIKERPAAVLIGGDFIYHPTEDDEPAEAKEEFGPEEAAEVRELIDRVASLFRPLADSGLPVYAVLGNHDYAMEEKTALALPWVAAELAEALEALGIVVLQNEAVPLPGPSGASATANQTLYLVGIGAHYPGNDHVEKAFSALPETASRIVLMHNPQSFAPIPAGQAPLAMAGHTHGGQIRIPFLPDWSWMALFEAGEVHADGWIQDFGQPGNRLYVNRGIGFSLIPIRINCPPEVTWFTLTRK